MTTKVVPGQLVAVLTADDLANEGATRMARVLRSALAKNRRASLALSGGNTPRDAYARLGRELGIDWTKVDVFWVDERAVAPTDARSNYGAAKATLLDQAAVPAPRVRRMRAEAPDREDAGAAIAQSQPCRPCPGRRRRRMDCENCLGEPVDLNSCTIPWASSRSPASWQVWSNHEG